MLRFGRLFNIDYFNGLLDHGSLSGLLDDDHTQYLLADGSRPLGGNWDLGGYDLTNGGAGHNNFSDYVANEHIDWTNASSVFYTSEDVNVGTGLTVNLGQASGYGILLYGSGTIPNGDTRGGFIRFYGANSSEGIYSHLYLNKNKQLVFDTDTQASETDAGKAWINCYDGSASFAQGNFTVNASGDLTANSLSDGVATISGGAITGATNTNWDAAYTHINSDGTDHTYIDQDLRTTAIPTFTGSSSNTNLFLGLGAANDDEGTYNVFIGYQAGYHNDDADSKGYKNVYIGYQSGYGNTSGLNNKSFYNVGIGYRTLYYNTTGDYNFALGAIALHYNNTGNYNMAFGHSAMYNNRSGSYNVAIGTRSCGGLSGGNYSPSESVCVGYKSGAYLRTVSQNTFIGMRSGYATTTGTKNTCIGAYAGEDITTGSYNICIGSYAGETNLTTQSYKLYIDPTNTSTPLIYGDFDQNVLAFRVRIDGTGDPSGIEGQLYCNATDKVIKMYCDGAWRTLASW